MEGYYGDFVALTPSSIRLQALQVFTGFRRISGITLNDSKSVSDPPNAYLGLMAESHSLLNNMVLPISLTAGKPILRPDHLKLAARRKSITHRALGRMVGELSFSQTGAFSRLTRTMSTPMCAKLYAIPYLTESAIY